MAQKKSSPKSTHKTSPKKSSAKSAASQSSAKSAAAEMPQTKLTGKTEFVALMAFAMSLIALSIDAMLPALSNIGNSLNVTNPNDNQLVIASVFVGMGIGILFYGPLSDSYGRKSSVHVGLTIFIFGSIISLLATSFLMMLLGRLLQGFGAAGPRVIIVAMVRDRYQGKIMASVMSLIMMVFMIVPALAPSLGQLILFVADWRAIFGSFIILGSLCMLWFWLRQEETLPLAKRRDFSLKVIFFALSEVMQHPITRGYTLTAALVFAAFVGYLISSQQILQIQYGLGILFPIYFSSLAIIFALSAFVNSKLIATIPVERLCLYALGTLAIISVMFYFYARVTQGHPPLYSLMGYLAIVFFCCGVLFGNLNALAMQPMGHIAGVATSAIAAVQTLVSVTFGAIIARNYNGTVLPLIFGFLLMALAAFFIAHRTGKKFGHLTKS